jgi:hypothetical protein
MSFSVTFNIARNSAQCLIHPMLVEVYHKPNVAIGGMMMSVPNSGGKGTSNASNLQTYQCNLITWALTKLPSAILQSSRA